MTFKIDGVFNEATVHLPDKDSVDKSCIEQIEAMVDAEAFEGDSDIAIMPDTHWGSGAVIGFTMPVKDAVCPNTIGVDIGCGMTAVKVDTPMDLHDSDNHEPLDKRIRSKVPVGFDTHNWNSYHMKDDFPWERCEEKFESFEVNTAFDFDESPEYGIEYFKNLCERVDYNPSRAINSIGTLGGGNHFIEIGYDESDDDEYWVIIHSGSRGIGASIAQHWQETAKQMRSAHVVRTYFDSLDSSYSKYIKFDWNTASDKEVIDWVKGGMGEKFFSYDELKSDYEESNPEMIGEIGDALDSALHMVKSSGGDHSYLEGDDAYGYIRDMVFAQTYASESRKEMAKEVSNAIAEVAGKNYSMAYYHDSIESVHNYIDFEDGVIRKGACRAHDGERLVVPFNMKYGTLICEGKGNGNWNKSSAHGAGRAMSRTEAKNRYDAEYMQNETAGVFMSETPVDETPSSYKDPEMVREALGENVSVQTRVIPLISIKAP